MRTQISGNSFNEEKQFSGVYLQQGRMLLDSDWNEQVDIAKRAQQNAMADAIGSGIPKTGGVSIDASGRISAGVFYADGERVELLQSVALMHTLPPVPTNQELVFYADVYEREITAVEDEDIYDPALYGADTCTRTQKVVQSRWIKKTLFEGLGETGKSQCTIRRVGPIDPCLFRLEIHAVDYAAKQVTLKWSFENGAEQYAHDAYPKSFVAGHWVYEFFSTPTERQYGLNMEGSSLTRPKLTQNIDDNPGNLPFVKRWDGFAIIKYSQLTNGILKNGSLHSFFNNGVPLDKNLGQGIGGAIGYGAAGNIFSVNLGSLLVELYLDMDALLVGDYWQVKIREQYSMDPLDHARPNGYRHRYLKLAEKKPGQPLKMVDGLHASFPSLTTIASDDIAGATDGMTVADELAALAAKDVEQDGRIDQCESDIVQLRESLNRDAERLALWGRGVVAGFVPKELQIKVVLKRAEVLIAFTSSNGSLIDGTGALWMNAGAASSTFFADGVFAFHNENKLKATLKEKYGVTGVQFKYPLASVLTFSDNPVLLLEILQAYATFDLPKVLKRDDVFDPRDFVQMDTKGAVDSPIYVYPENGALKTVCALFTDAAGNDDLVFDISRRTRRLLGRFERGIVSRTASDKYTRAGIRESFKMIEANPRAKGLVIGKSPKPTALSDYEKEWAAYACYPQTIAPNDGQVCVGSLMVVGSEASVTADRREQVYTSPFMQLSPLFKAAPATGGNTGGASKRFDVKVTKVGASKLKVISAMRTLTGWELKTVKDLVDDGPFVAAESVTSAMAADYKAALEKAGATVQLVGVGDSVDDTGKGGSSIFVEAVGGQKVKVIKAVREITGLGLVEAKNLVDVGVFSLLHDVNEADATAFRKKLEAAGATVRVVK